MRSEWAVGGRVVGKEWRVRREVVVRWENGVGARER